MADAPAPIPIVPLPIPQGGPPANQPMVSGLPIGSLLIAAGPWLTVMLVLVVVSLVRFRSGAGIRGRTAGFPAQDDFHAGRSPGPLHDSRYLEQILQAELEAESAAAAQAHAAPPTPDPSARS